MRQNWRHRRPIFSSPPAPKPEKKRRWQVLPILWLALKKTCMALGAGVLVLSIYGVIVFSQLTPYKAPPLPDQIVLYLPLEGALVELPKAPNFADPFPAGAPTVRELIAAIDKAATDNRVKGIYARLEPGHFSVAHVQELRTAIKRFKETGKFAHIYAQSYGDIAGGFGGYYLASAFDEIWMQPMGVVSITGINIQSPYLRSVLDKIGVEPNFFQRKEYKTAYESLTKEEMSPENREMLGDVLADIKAEFMKDIPGERGFSSAQFSAYVDQGLFTAEEAEQAKLVTTADYADILVERITEDLTGDPEYEDPLFIDIKQYVGDMRRAKNTGTVPDKLGGVGKPKVALVYAVGAIMPSDAGGRGNIAAADKIAPALLSAGDDDDIKAVVLRIDSPGGSPTASESILRAVEKVQAKGKPVIVSMGPTAASGGYWIAAYADQIFVMPTTLTGSIGVVGGKFSAEELMNKVGVSWQGVQWGENVGMWSFLEPYSDSEAERVNVMLDAVYDGFIARVAKGRKMSPAAVDRIAKGRVWTGARAIDIGLADQIGGLSEALDYAAQQLDKENKNDISVVVLPKPKTPFEQFLELVGDGTGVTESLRVQAALGKVLAPILDEAAMVQNPQDYSVYAPTQIR